MKDPVPALERILTEAEDLLRLGLERHQLGEIDHVILALTPGGDAVIRSNCEPAALRAMALLLTEIADENTPQPDRKSRH